MNLRERLKVRTLVNFVICVLERLVNLAIKLSPKNSPVLPAPKKPEKKKPLKKVVDTINNIVPWRK